jgi:hypothetical protein
MTWQQETFHMGMQVVKVLSPKSISMCASCLRCSLLQWGLAADQQEHYRQLPNLCLAAKALHQKKCLG